MFRRSGVVPPLEGDEQRIFDAVVKPERAKANGNADAERERLRGEIARAEKHARQRALRAERAGRGRRGRAREARALPARARCNRRLTGCGRSVPGPPTASARSAWSSCSPGSATRSAPSGRCTSSGRRASRPPRGGAARATVGGRAYTSPHVSGWHERLAHRPGRFERAVGRVRADAEARRRDAVRDADRGGLRRLRGAGVESAAIEAGLGGRSTRRT